MIDSISAGYILIPWDLPCDIPWDAIFHDQLLSYPGILLVRSNLLAAGGPTLISWDGLYPIEINCDRFYPGGIYSYSMGYPR